MERCAKGQQCITLTTVLDTLTANKVFTDIKPSFFEQSTSIYNHVETYPSMNRNPQSVQKQAESITHVVEMPVIKETESNIIMPTQECIDTFLPQTPWVIEYDICYEVLGATNDKTVYHVKRINNTPVFTKTTLVNVEKDLKERNKYKITLKLKGLKLGELQNLASCHSIDILSGSKKKTRETLIAELLATYKNLKQQTIL